MHTLKTGTRTEAVVLAALISAGYDVLTPFGTLRYDLAVDVGQLVRIQVKTGRISKGTIIWHTTSTGPARRSPAGDYRGHAELFAVWGEALEHVHLVPVDEVGTSCGSLRLEPSRNHQTNGIRWAHDYQLQPGTIERLLRI